MNPLTHIRNTAFKSCLGILIATLAASCCTEAVWESRLNPDYMTEVHYFDMTESALIEDGFTYTKDDEKQLYFVQTTKTQGSHWISPLASLPPLSRLLPTPL